MSVVFVNADLLIYVFVLSPEKERTFYFQIDVTVSKSENQWTNILY
jgi:hypothetical protein